MELADNYIKNDMKTIFYMWEKLKTKIFLTQIKLLKSKTILSKVKHSLNGINGNYKLKKKKIVNSKDVIMKTSKWNMEEQEMSPSQNIDIASVR